MRDHIGLVMVCSKSSDVRYKPGTVLEDIFRFRFSRLLAHLLRPDNVFHGSPLMASTWWNCEIRCGQKGETCSSSPATMPTHTWPGALTSAAAVVVGSNFSHVTRHSF